MHKFVDDNTLPAYGETVFKLIDTSELESNIAIDFTGSYKKTLC